MIDFVFDHVWDQARPAPNIARWQARPYTPEWHQFSQHWPWSEPVMFYEYCRVHGIAVRAITHDQVRHQAFYPIALTFFDHDTQHLDLVPQAVKQLCQQCRVKILIFYSEGDNPGRIRQSLDQQCLNNSLPPESVILISANTEASTMQNCRYFADDELLFRLRNQQHPAVAPDNKRKRPHAFTSLVRTHKWWRATTMTEMQRRGWLQRAIWSYNTQVALDEPFTDNPIRFWYRPGLKQSLELFMENGPYRADALDHQAHNDHTHHVREHYTNSYFQVVLETHFDADGSRGAFVTEKTFKPIKHAQPFVIFGAAGTLSALRGLGYRTFDSVIDNSYDQELDNNRRWEKVFDAIQGIMQQKNLRDWYQRCWPDLEHNQRLFTGDLTPRLNSLLESLTWN
jgi:hypothetical protein